MKRIALIFAALCLTAVTAIAQNPTPEIDTLRIPIKQGDPELKTLPSDLYLKDHRRIMPAELPKPVRTTLEAGTQYEGWERAPIYRNKKGDRFIVEITSGDRTETFQFDAKGRPVALEQ